MSAAQKVRRSIAVSRVCLRDGTYTSTGFRGACVMMALYAGLAMATSRDALWVILKPWYNVWEEVNAGQRDLEIMFISSGFINKMHSIKGTITLDFFHKQCTIGLIYSDYFIHVSRIYY